MPQLKPLQSEGGFSVAEATIIDENRNIIDANSVKVLSLIKAMTFGVGNKLFILLNLEI